MNSRINVRFLAILVLALLVFGAAGYALYRVRHDPRRYRVRADRFARAGEYDKAAASYAQAIRRNDRDPVTYLNLARVLEKLSPQPLETALARTQQMVSALEHAVELDPGLQEARSRLLKYYLNTARATQAPEAWQLLGERTRAILGLLERHGGKSDIALRRAAALAASHRLRLRPGRTPGQVGAVLTQLEAVLKQAPADRLVALQVAEWHALAAGTARRAGKTAEAAAEWQHVETALKGVQGDFSGQVSRVRLALTAGRASGGIRSRIDALAKAATAQHDPFALRQLAQLLVLTAGPTEAKRKVGFEQATVLLRRAVQETPLDSAARLELVEVLRRQGRLAPALALAEQVRAPAGDLPIGVPAVVARYYAPVAALTVADILLKQASATRHTAKVRDELERARRVLDKLDATPRFSAAVGVRRARLELLDGHPGTALDLLLGAEKNAQSGRLAPVPTRLAVRAFEALGETGEAVRRLEGLIKTASAAAVFPGDWLRLARLRIRAGQPRAALDTVEEILARAPGNVEARVLEFLALADLARACDVRGDGKAENTLALARTALAHFKIETLPTPVIVAAVRLLDWFGRVDEAGKTLERAMAGKTRPDLALVRLRAELAFRLGKSEAGVEIVRRAYRERPDAPGLARTVAEIERGVPGEQAIRLLPGAAKGDRVADLLDWAAYCLAVGRPQAAEQALKEATEIAPNSRRVLAARFSRALDRGDSRTAIRLAEGLDRIDPDPVKTALRRARIAMRTREYAGAEKRIRNAIAHRGPCSEAWWLLGEVARLQGKPKTAADAYRRALRLKPELAPAHLALSRLAYARAESRTALDELEAAAICVPEDFGLWQNCLDALAAAGESTRAQQLRERLAKRLPGDHRNRRALAALYERADCVAAAEKMLRALVTETPGSPDDNWALARFFDRQGNHVEGVKGMRAFIEHAREKAEFPARVLFARYLAATRLDRAAVEAYRQAIRIEDKSTLPATVELARAFVRRGRVEEALSYYKRAAATVRNPAILLGYVGALAAVGKNAAATAQLAAYDKQFGEDSKSAVLAGLLASNRGDLAQAAAAFDRAVRLNPGDARALFLRARYWFQHRSREHWSHSRDDLLKAIEINPRFLPPRELLAEWLLENRPPDRTAAVAVLHGILKIRPDYTPSRLQLAGLLLSTGKYAELQAFLAESRARFPDLPVWNRISAALAAARGKPEVALRELERFFQKDHGTVAGELYAGALLEADKPAAALEVFSAFDTPLPTPLLQALKGRALVAAGHAAKGKSALVTALDAAASQQKQLLEVITQVGRTLPASPVVALLDAAAKRHATAAFDLETAAADLLRAHGDFAGALARLEAVQTGTGVPPDRRAMLLKGIASLYVLQGRYENALAAYREALDLAPEDPTVLNDTAFLLAEHLGRPGEALPLAEKAVAQSAPYSRTHAAALDTLGWSRFRAGKPGIAESALRQSLQEWPESSNRLHLIKVLDATGKKAEARALAKAAEKPVRK